MQLRGCDMMYCNINGGNTQHHFVEFRGCGHDKSDPTAADGLPFCGCIRICKYQKIVLTRTLATRYGTTTYTEYLLSHCKNHTFAMQKPPFYIAKTPFLACKKYGFCKALISRWLYCFCVSGRCSNTINVRNRRYS